MLSDTMLAALDRATLTPPVRTATGCPTFQISDWQATQLSHQGRRRVMRFAGTGDNGAEPQSWSLILKVIHAPESADDHDTALDDWAYWEREYLMYAAGIPQSLAGSLRAPYCFGVAAPAPNQRWIWLEDLHDLPTTPWTLDQYAYAAEQLGHLNGTYLAGRQLPNVASLTDNGLRTRSAHALASLARLYDPAIWEHPLLRRAFPHPILTDLERLAADREGFLAAAMRLPFTFCHQDAWHGNMAILPDPSGVPEVILFDWALCGYAPPGIELSNLIWSSLLEFKVPLHAAEQFESMLFTRYCAGLNRAGCRVDAGLVRRAYLIGSVLLFGLTPEAVDHARNEGDHAALERFYGQPIEQLVTQAAGVSYLLLQRAEELRGLLADSTA